MTPHQLIAEQHAHCLLFSSLNGTRYLFDAATSSIHPWPWQMTSSEIDRLYSAPDAELLSIGAEIGAPAELARYISVWRSQAGAFRGWSHVSHCGISGSHSQEVGNPALQREPPTWRPLPVVFGNLMLVVTDACNLRCQYCIFSDFYDDFHAYRPQRMSWDTARKAVDQFLALNESRPFLGIPNRKLDIAFFGGEPLLEGDLIRRVVAYARSRERPHYWIDFSLTTNLMYLPDDLAAFLVENDVGLQVSIDGPPWVHDRYRVDALGRGSFGMVWRNLEKLYRISAKFFDKRVRAVVTLNGNSDLEAIRDFFESGERTIPRVSYVGLIRDLQDGAFHRRYPYDAERFRKQYLKLLAEYHKRKRQRVPVVQGDFFYHLFEEALASLYKRMMTPGTPTRFTYTGTCMPGRRIAVATDGTFHLCERINENFPIGDVERGFDLDRCLEVQRQYYRALPDCDHCWARGICQACFASVCNHSGFEFSQKRCDTMRSDLALLLSSLYALLEKVPDALSCGDVLIDRHRLVETVT